ncbi:uncharacterized protein O9250_015583 [Rhynochetos jubatus]
MAATKEIFTLLSLPTATTVVAMAAPKILTMLQTILQNVQMVGEELDEATHKCMQQHAEQLGQEMTRLLHELEQSGFAWRALLFAPLQHWQFWTVAGVLLLLFGLCWWLRRRSYEPDRRRAEQSCSSNTQEEVEVHEVDSEDALGRSFAKRIPWPVQNLAYRSRVMEELAGDLLRVFHLYFSGSFFPVLQPVIRVGSTFEGWSPREEDARYRLLLPLQPPRGHAFRLELGTAGEMPAKDSRVRVALECICRRPELVDDTLCFLHHPEEELRENQAPSLLHTLCTGSYLDAQKTARWFQDTVRSAWGVVPLSRLYKMNLLPSSRSCKMQLISTSGRSLFAKIIFGVQLGVSDIFLSSQPAEPGLIPSTRWPQSCVVAEAKFFRVVARQAPRDSFHLKCLQICARILEGTAFSTYTFKTAVMHLLTTTPLSDWRRRHFMLRLEDIMRYLDDCLKEKRLNHFFFGNEHVPEEIILPPAFPTAEPPNLFQHLAQDPAAHARAMTEFDELQNRLTSLLFYGRVLLQAKSTINVVFEQMLRLCARCPCAEGRLKHLPWEPYANRAPAREHSAGSYHTWHRIPPPTPRHCTTLYSCEVAQQSADLRTLKGLQAQSCVWKESGDYGGHKGDFHAAFSSHCHDGGGELRGAEKLPGRSGWAGTKREALRMCLPVLSGAPVENLPLPDAPQGVTAARRDMLDTEKTVLSTSSGTSTAGTEILPCRGPILPPGYTPSPTRRSHEGTKSTNASSEVGEELDEATHKCMQQHAEQLGQEMTRLLHELEQSGFAWRALLFAPLQHWQFWTVAGVLLLLFGLCWWLRRRSYEPDRRRAEQSCSSNTQEEVEVHEVDSEDALGRSFAKRIPWPVQNLAYRSRVMEELAGDLLRVFHMYFSGSFFPVLQPVIRVGSTFEGWSPREEDARYRLLLPLQPPRGHAFRLELGTAGEMPAKDSRVRVELECICRRPELVDDTLCFLHHPEEELRENQAPSLLHTLCTGSYLDAQKTARWFQDTVRSAWGVVPLSRLYKMNLLPSSRSCKMQLISTSGRSLFAEIIFGVQLGVSDIFLSSQPAEPGLIPSTRWPQSCVVAEAKFFRVVARQAPRDSFHLKCLQICARILEGTAFSTYTFKTAVMHLLTTTPLSDWRRRHFMLRLEDIMRYLDDCLKEKRLNHFFFGNEHVPEEIILPPAFPTAEPPNLFQHLAQDPAAHARAMTEFDELQNRLTSLLFYGR